MNTTSFKRRVSRQISKLEAQLEKLRALRELDDPLLAGILDDDEQRLDDDEKTSKKTGPRKFPILKKSLYERAKTFFRGRDNAPASISDIASGTGAEASYVRNLFYVSRKDDVEKIQTGDLTLWRLKRLD